MLLAQPEQKLSQMPQHGRQGSMSYAGLSGQGSLMALMLFRQTILDASKAQDTHKRTIPGSTSENEMYQKSPAFKQLLQSVGSSLSGAPDDPEQVLRPA